MGELSSCSSSSFRVRHSGFYSFLILQLSAGTGPICTLSIFFEGDTNCEILIDLPLPCKHISFPRELNVLDTKSRSYLSCVGTIPCLDDPRSDLHLVAPGLSASESEMLKQSGKFTQRLRCHDASISALMLPMNEASSCDGNSWDPPGVS